MGNIREKSNRYESSDENSGEPKMSLTIQQASELLRPFQDMKARFPFRLGTTSYIYPGEILPNVELLSEILDEVQILLFEGRSHSNLPDAPAAERLRTLAEQKNIRYSVHLPLDVYPGHLDESFRKNSVRVIERIYRVGCSFNCETFVFHYANRNPEGKPFQDLSKWRDQLRKSSEELLLMGIPATALCVENLGYPYSWVTDLIHNYGLSKCIDIGHLRVNSHPVNTHLRRHIAQTKIIHLHGLKKGVDHNGLSRTDCVSVRKLFRKINEFAYRGSVILEVFQLDHLIESLQTFRSCWNRWEKEKLS
jgi:adenosylcobalamin phosphodiesterase